MEWIVDPTAWAGLVTLVFIELILGIDNLVFIAILIDKLPARQRDFARKLGLLLALAMRIVLLTGISWLADLRAPVATMLGRSFSGRELILLAGGLFLLWKATTEVHSRVEGRLHRGEKTYRASFWMVVTQIVVLDAVFSLDAVITAVGMVDHLMVMVLAVTIAIFMMIAVSRPLTAFVSRHPTVLILCLGFLLMVGFSLIAEGFGLHIPKGYLYAAIAFSVMIEAINQFAQAKLKQRVQAGDNPRQRTANALLKLLGAKPVGGVEEVQEANAVLQEAVKSGVLGAVDKNLLRGVLNLSERPVHTIMTPRMDVKYVDIRAPKEAALETVKAAGVSQVLAVDGDMDNVIGILRTDDFMRAWMSGEDPLAPKILNEAMFVQKRAPVMELLDIFKKYPTDLAVVIDEAGGVEGVATHFDVLEAITGEFPDRDEPYFTPIQENANGSYTVDGAASIYDLRNRLGIDYDPDGRFATAAGLVLHELGRVPAQGDRMEWHGWLIEVRHMEGRRVNKLRLTRLPAEAD